MNRLAHFALPPARYRNAPAVGEVNQAAVVGLDILGIDHVGFMDAQEVRRKKGHVKTQ